MKEKLKKNRKIIDILILILVGCILCFSFLNPNIDIYFDDGIQHIARAYGTSISLQEDGIMGNIISSFTNNFGYSWNLFYGPLSTYSLIIIEFILNNFINAYKTLNFICLILSGIFMYKFVNSITSNNDTSLLSSILYMSFPYHLTDMYIRNALGETISFAFIPIVFLGIYNLFYSNKNSYYITIGAVGLILTHNISTVIVAFFALFYAIFSIEKLKDKKILKLLVSNVIFILLISCFYWMPLLETKFSSNYQVFVDGMMATQESVSSHGLKITQFFVTQNDGSYVFELGPHVITMLAFSIMTLRRIDSKIKEHYCFFLVSGLLTLWMSTKYFPWKWLSEVFCFIQFPWRMLMMSSFFLSLICALNMHCLIRKFNFKDVLIISVIALYYIVALFASNVRYNPNIADITHIEKSYFGRFSGKEVETVAGAGKGEYLPLTAYKNRFYIASREDAIYVLTGKALIEDEKKNGTTYSAKLKTLDADYTVFELPYIYYPGYEVRLDGMIVQTFETENGFLGFIMGKEDDAELMVTYEGSTIMHTTMLIAIVSSIIFIVICVKSTKTLKNEEK